MKGVQTSINQTKLRLLDWIGSYLFHQLDFWCRDWLWERERTLKLIWEKSTGRTIPVSFSSVIRPSVQGNFFLSPSIVRNTLWSFRWMISTVFFLVLTQPVVLHPKLVQVLSSFYDFQSFSFLLEKSAKPLKFDLLNVGEFGEFLISVREQNSVAPTLPSFHPSLIKPPNRLMSEVQTILSFLSSFLFSLFFKGRKFVRIWAWTWKKNIFSRSDLAFSGRPNFIIFR